MAIGAGPGTDHCWLVVGGSRANSALRAERGAGPGQAQGRGRPVLSPGQRDEIVTERGLAPAHDIAHSVRKFRALSRPRRCAQRGPTPLLANCRRNRTSKSWQSFASR